jgi:hypothetical protein
VGIINQKVNSDFVPAATPSPEESKSDNKASADISSDSEPVKTKVTKAKPMSKLSIKKVLKAPVTRECMYFLFVQFVLILTRYMLPRARILMAKYTSSGCHFQSRTPSKK